MTRLAIFCIGDRHHATAESQRSISVQMNYPYFYFHLALTKELLGLEGSFDTRNDVDYKAYKTPPCLYNYSKDKGFKFHSEAWEVKLTKPLETSLCRFH